MSAGTSFILAPPVYPLLDVHHVAPILIPIPLPVQTDSGPFMVVPDPVLLDWIFSVLAVLAGPGFAGCVTPKRLTIEAHSQAGTVRHGDDPLLVRRDRPVEELGS